MFFCFVREWLFMYFCSKHPKQEKRNEKGFETNKKHWYVYTSLFIMTAILIYVIIKLIKRTENKKR